MKRFLCVILAFIITIGCVPSLAAEPDWNGPLSADASPTVLDTGRGYLVYYWYSSAIYYSEDGATWTDLSDRSWVKEAALYTVLTTAGHGHREFEVLWTGTEYMMRQSLLDDPRANGVLGDSPRNSVVIFLDEDFQVIGEQSFDGPVTAIRCGDGAYYATVGGVETAFSREDWAGLFTDVAPDAWYAPYVEVCVEEGLMKGVGGGLFAPEAYLTQEESLVLLMRLYDLLQGGDGEFNDLPPEAWGTARLTYEDGTTLLLSSEQIGRVGSHSGSWYTAALSPEDRTVAEAHLEQSATLTDLATGESFPAHCSFQPEWADDHDLQISEGFLPGFFASPYKEEWYGNALWYALENGFFNPEINPGAESLTVQVGHSWVVQRNEFTSALAGVVGDLERINQAPSLFLNREYHEDIYRLYEAGIVTQLDSSGDLDFHRFYSPITRAEAATMVARVLRPELRVTFTSPPPQDSATQD